jgi:hypothetical protein
LLSTGFLDLEGLFTSKPHYPKLKLLLIENCDLVLTEAKSLAQAAGSGDGGGTSGGKSGGGELDARLLLSAVASKKLVRFHLHGCRYQCADGSFVEATAGGVASRAALSLDAARAAAFVGALASSASSSSSSSSSSSPSPSSSPGGGGGGSGPGGGGGGKKARGSSQKKVASPPPPSHQTFKGVCFGCDAWGKWDDFVDEMEWARREQPPVHRYWDY